MRSLCAKALLATLVAGALACSSGTEESTPIRLEPGYSGFAGTDFRLYFLILAFEKTTDSVTGTWELAYQTTCHTQQGHFRGQLRGASLTLSLDPGEPTDAAFTMRFASRDSGRLRGTILSAIPGSEPLCFDDFADITLRPDTLQPHLSRQ